MPAANLREILQTNDLNGAKEYIVEGTPEKGPVTSGIRNVWKCHEMLKDQVTNKPFEDVPKLANKLLEKKI